MRRCSVVAFALAAACTHALPSSEPAPVATPSSVDSGENPCAQAGRCSITVMIPNDALYVLKDYMVFNVFPGCPKALGFRQDGVQSPFSAEASAPPGSATIARNTSMRRGKPVAQSSEQTIILPAMSGPVATVGIFYGAEPGKYAVVNFKLDPNQTVKFGYLLSAGSLLDDKLVDSQNRSIERKLCP